MLRQSHFIRALPAVLLLSAASLLPGCGGSTNPTDTPRVATGSKNTQGLWRITEKFDNETFYSTALIEGTGSTVAMTDCSRAFASDSLTRSSNQYTGYTHDIAPLTIINNDAMTWTYDNQTRDFEKMDVNPQFNMGNFTLSSSLLPNVVASQLVCTQFSTSDQGESLVLTTRVLGNPLLITIRLKNGFKVGTYNISPYGDEPTMVIFSGPHWALTTLLAYDEVATGTLTIKSRGNVWIEGELQGQLLNGNQPVNVSFNVETPVH